MSLRDQMEEIYRGLPPEQIPWNLERPPELLADLVQSIKIEPCEAVDVGCGAGNYAVWLATQGFRMTGFDLSPAALELAGRLAREKGVSCQFLGGVQFWGTGTMTAGGGYMVSDDSSRTRATDLVGAFGTDYLKTRLFSDWAGAAKLVEAAHKRGWPVSGHIGLPLPLIAAGIDGMEHLGPSGLRTDEIVYDDIIQLFRNSNMWIIPTVIGYSSVVGAIDDPTIFDDSAITPFLKWWGLRLPPNFRIGYDRFARDTRTSALKLYEGGVIIAAGSDAPVLPWALHAELEELVAAGLSPLAAINAATQTAARVLGASDEIGTIEEGKWADLVILNADPLQDIKNTRDIWMVIKGGAEVDRELLGSWVAQSASVIEFERQ